MVFCFIRIIVSILLSRYFPSLFRHVKLIQRDISFFITFWPYFYTISLFLLTTLYQMHEMYPCKIFIMCNKWTLVSIVFICLYLSMHNRKTITEIIRKVWVGLRLWISTLLYISSLTDYFYLKVIRINNFRSTWKHKDTFHFSWSRFLFAFLFLFFWMKKTRLNIDLYLLLLLLHFVLLREYFVNSHEWLAICTDCR